MEDSRLLLIEKSLDNIAETIKEVKTISTENRSILMGDLNCKGIITTLAVMDQKIGNIELLTTNHLAHLTEKFDLMFSTNASLQNANSKDNIGWREIINGWMKPIITALIIGLIMAFVKN